MLKLYRMLAVNNYRAAANTGIVLNNDRIEMRFLKQPFTLSFRCQIDSNEVSCSKLKPGLCNRQKIEIIESTVSPQLPHKRGTNFLG